MAFINWLDLHFFTTLKWIILSPIIFILIFVWLMIIMMVIVTILSVLGVI